MSKVEGNGETATERTLHMVLGVHEHCSASRVRPGPEVSERRNAVDEQTQRTATTRSSHLPCASLTCRDCARVTWTRKVLCRQNVRRTTSTTSLSSSECCTADICSGQGAGARRRRARFSLARQADERASSAIACLASLEEPARPVHRPPAMLRFRRRPPAALGMLAMLRYRALRQMCVPTPGLLPARSCPRRTDWTRWRTHRHRYRLLDLPATSASVP